MSQAVFNLLFKATISNTRAEARPSDFKRCSDSKSEYQRLLREAETAGRACHRRINN